MTEDFEIISVGDMPEGWTPSWSDPMAQAILSLLPGKAIKKNYPTHRMAKLKMKRLLANFHRAGVQIHTKIIRNVNEADCDLYVWRHIER